VRGKVTSVGVTLTPVSQIVMEAVFAEIWVWSWKSAAVPETRTRSPRFTESLFPLKTKIPSEVAASPSPVRSCR